MFRLLLLILIMANNAHAESFAPNEVATFAAGCFWCIQPPYDKQEGVLGTKVGYIGGKAETADYQKVSSGATGHYEAIQITFSPDLVSYEKILDIFWNNIDPFDDGGQFCDRGKQYLSAVFYHDQKQKDLAEKTKQQISKEKGKQVVTPIIEAGKFYSAEDYHQKYYKKNPLRYKMYRNGCGRDRRLNEIWNKKD